jgi:signal transduction histidine kinase
VTLLMLIGTGVSLEDDFGISISRSSTAWLPGFEGLVLVVAGSLVLAVRRVLPVAVFVVAGLSTMGYELLGYGPEPLPLAVLVALYTVAVNRRPIIAFAAAAGYVLVFTLIALVGWLTISDDQYYTDLVSIVATGMLGYGVALGRAQARLAEKRATRLAQSQEDRMRAAVEQEQARIAREVHDIVAHDVSVMVAQAAAARLVFDSQPRVAAEALASVEAVGRDALDGLRRLVTLLRTESEESGGRSPQPGLDRLPWLVEQVQRAGLPVELEIRGEVRPLPGTVELNAFRIVQEALTNSLKHAGRRGATVTLDYQDDALRVEVRDLGGQPPDRQLRNGSSGYGLISMQTRAEMLGGRLEAGPDYRGFRVAVALPLAGVSA